MVGFVHVLPRGRVRPGEGGVAAAVKVIRQFGVGSLELADPPKPSNAAVERVASVD